MDVWDKLDNWEQHLEKCDRKIKLARKVFFWSVSCILLGMVVVKTIDLIPESKPEYNESGYSGVGEDIVIVADGGADTITFTFDDTSADGAIMIESSDGDLIFGTVTTGDIDWEIE